MPPLFSRRGSASIASHRECQPPHYDAHFAAQRHAITGAAIISSACAIDVRELSRYAAVAISGRGCRDEQHTLSDSRLLPIRLPDVIRESCCAQRAAYVFRRFAKDAALTIDYAAARLLLTPPHTGPLHCTRRHARHRRRRFMNFAPQECKRRAIFLIIDTMIARRLAAVASFDTHRRKILMLQGLMPGYAASPIDFLSPARRFSLSEGCGEIDLLTPLAIFRLFAIIVAIWAADVIVVFVFVITTVRLMLVMMAFRM